MRYLFKQQNELKETEVTISANAYNQEVQDIEHLLEQYQQTKQILKIKTMQKIYQIPLNKIMFIEVFGDYTTIHTIDEDIRIHQSLQAIEQQIEDQSFIRVSRNTLLNLNYVEKFKNSFSGTSVAILNDGTLVNISRRFWKMVKERVLNQ